MFFPGQYRLGIFLGYQKSQTFFDKVSMIKKKRTTVTGSERTQQCKAYTKYSLKPLLKGHLRDLPKCPLNRGCKNCAMFFKD